MAPEAALTKKPDKDKQPEKKVGGTGSAHWDVIKDNGGKPDVLDMPVIGYQLTGTAISKGVTGVKNLMKKKESHPDPKLEGKGKRRSSFVRGERDERGLLADEKVAHENYDRPDTGSSLQSGDGSMQ